MFPIPIFFIFFYTIILFIKKIYLRNIVKLLNEQITAIIIGKAIFISNLYHLNS